MRGCWGRVVEKRKRKRIEGAGGMCVCVWFLFLFVCVFCVWHSRPVEGRLLKEQRKNKEKSSISASKITVTPICHGILSRNFFERFDFVTKKNRFRDKPIFSLTHKIRFRDKPIFSLTKKIRFRDKSKNSVTKKCQ